MNINKDLLLKIIDMSDNRFELWQKIITLVDVKNMAEIGVWKGDYANSILKNCKKIEQYYMIDPWANLPDWNKPCNIKKELFEEIFDEAMSKTLFAKNKLIILRGRTKEMVENIPDNSLDFVYIDGDHTLRGITIDLIKILPKMKEGAIIAGDDFINSPWQHSIEYEPTLVCPLSIYFAEAMNYPIFALPYGQFLIQKKQNVKFFFEDLTGKFSNLSLNKLPSGFVRQTIKKK